MSLPVFGHGRLCTFRDEQLSTLLGIWEVGVDGGKGQGRCFFSTSACPSLQLSNAKLWEAVTISWTFLFPFSSLKFSVKV